MATFLDISSLSFFSSIFTFILVFVALYSLLSYAKFLGENNGIHALIAFSISILTLFSKDAIEVINFVVPWFVMLFIGMLLMLLAYSLFNPGGNVFDLLVGGDKHKTIIYWIISLSVIIILIGLGNSFGERVGPYLDGDNNTNIGSAAADNIRGDGLTATDDFNTNLGATLFHPKILGLLVILLLGTFTIMTMASR